MKATPTWSPRRHTMRTGGPSGTSAMTVIGSGLGKLYPPENLALAEKIASGFGAVVSEFPLHTSPDKQTFPMRNRIVAGMSEAVVVIESDVDGGAMITARFAGEQGRLIFAMPGRIDQNTSAGCHQLIRDGATLLTSGLYRHVRHPVYSGLLVWAFGIAIASASLLHFVLFALLWLYFTAKAAHEERMLEQLFGNYAEYSARTPRFFPFPTYQP